MNPAPPLMTKLLRIRSEDFLIRYIQNKLLKFSGGAG
jgi:hypothetical protein